jgi:hypothetical protein
VPKDYTPLHLTKFGDWFFADASGHVFHLDLLEGTLSQVASSVDEYNTLKNQPDKHNDWFLDAFVFRCDREGLHLQPGQCYGWCIHPMIGGRFDFENIQIFPLSVYQSLMGQLLPRWAQLKPGDPIPQITIQSHRPLSGLTLIAGIGLVFILHSALFFVLYRGRAVSHWLLTESNFFLTGLPLLLAFSATVFLLLRSSLLLTAGTVGRALGLFALALLITFFSFWLSLLVPFNLYGT